MKKLYEEEKRSENSGGIAFTVSERIFVLHAFSVVKIICHIFKLLFFRFFFKETDECRIDYTKEYCLNYYSGNKL